MYGSVLANATEFFIRRERGYYEPTPAVAPESNTQEPIIMTTAKKLASAIAQFEHLAGQVSFDFSENDDGVVTLTATYPAADDATQAVEDAAWTVHGGNQILEAAGFEVKDAGSDAYVDKYGDEMIGEWAELTQVKPMKKATIHITGLGRIYVPGNIGAARNVFLCNAMTTDGTPVNMTSHRVSFAKTHYAEADEAEDAGYYLKDVGNKVFAGISHTFILVSKYAE